MVPDELASTMRCSPAQSAASSRFRVPSTCSWYILRASAGSRLTRPARWYSPSQPCKARVTESLSRTSPLKISQPGIAAPDRTSARTSCPAPVSMGMSVEHEVRALVRSGAAIPGCEIFRSEEHTSELQSHLNLVCRLLLEKK